MLSNQALPWAASGLLLLAIGLLVQRWLAGSGLLIRPNISHSHNIENKTGGKRFPEKEWLISSRLALVGAAGLLIMAVLSAVISAQPEITLPQVYRLVVGIGLAGVIALTAPALQPALVGWGAALAGLGLAGLGLFTVAWTGDKLPFVPKAIYTWLFEISQLLQSGPIRDSIHPNVFAGNLVLLLALSLGTAWGLWFVRPRRVWRQRKHAMDVPIPISNAGATTSGWWLYISMAGFGVILAPMLILLGLSQSRGGLMALAAAFVTLAGVHVLSRLRMSELRFIHTSRQMLSQGLESTERREVSSKSKPLQASTRRYWLGGLGAILVIGLLALLAWNRLPSMPPCQELLSLANSYLATGLDFRVEVWSRAWMIIRDFPLTGVGMGLFADTVQWFYPYTRTDAAAGMFVPHAHNLFLQIAVDLGIPGLISWLLVFGAAIHSAWQGARQGLALQNGWLLGLGTGLLAAFSAAAVHGLTDAVVWGMVRPAPLLWALFGLAFALPDWSK